MRRKLVEKCVSAGLILCLGMCSVTGCENKTVDYDAEEGTEDVQRRAGTGNMNLKQFEDTPRWQEEWTAENTEGNVVKLSVDAKISVPNAEQMSVVEVKEPTFDASYKEKITEQIFGSTEIYYNDIPHLPKKELEEGRADLAAMIEASADGIPEDYLNELEMELMSYDEALETAKDAYMPVTAYDADRYIGERDGIFYELSFAEYDSGYSIYRMKDMYFGPKDVYQVCPKEMSEMEGVSYTADENNLPISYDTSVENQCSLSAEEALEEARNFIEKLGLDYSVFRSSSPLFWRAYHEEIPEEDLDEYREQFTWEDMEEEEYLGGYKTKNGYMFTFDIGIDQLSFPLFGTQEQYAHYSKTRDAGKGRYALSATLNITVTDEGVIEMWVQRPLEITGVMEGVQLLPIDEVKGIVKEQVAQHFEDFRFDYSSVDGSIVFNKMELIYFRIRDKENSECYSYVPAWRLSKQDLSSDPIEFSNVVLINAIDGSMIDLFDEI